MFTERQIKDGRETSKSWILHFIAWFMVVFAINSTKWTENIVYKPGFIVYLGFCFFLFKGESLNRPKLN